MLLIYRSLSFVSFLICCFELLLYSSGLSQGNRGALGERFLLFQGDDDNEAFEMVPREQGLRSAVPSVCGRIHAPHLMPVQCKVRAPHPGPGWGAYHREDPIGQPGMANGD